MKSSQIILLAFKSVTFYQQQFNSQKVNQLQLFKKMTAVLCARLSSQQKSFKRAMLMTFSLIIEIVGCRFPIIAELRLKINLQTMLILNSFHLGVTVYNNIVNISKMYCLNFLFYYLQLVSMNYCNNQATKMEEPFHMALGEQTPGQKLKQVSQASVDMCETIRKAAEKRKLYYAMSPLPVRVRDMPIPKLSWADSKEMSVLMCHKEDLSLSNRNANIFRLHPNLTPRMRTILFDWLMEVCINYIKEYKYITL